MVRSSLRFGSDALSNATKGKKGRREREEDILIHSEPLTQLRFSLILSILPEFYSLNSLKLNPNLIRTPSYITISLFYYIRNIFYNLLIEILT